MSNQLSVWANALFILETSASGCRQGFNQVFWAYLVINYD